MHSTYLFIPKSYQFMIITGLYLYIFENKYVMFSSMCSKLVVWHRPSVGSLSYPLWLPPGNHRQFLFTLWHGWMFAFLRCGKMALSHTFVNSQLWNLRILNYFFKFLFVMSPLPEFKSSSPGVASKNADIIIPPPNEVGGGVYWIHLVRPSVRLSVCPSVRLSVDDMVSGA